MGRAEETLGKFAERFGGIYYRLRLAPHRELEYISPAIADFVGYPEGEFYRDPCRLLAIVHPDDQLALTSYVETPESPALDMLRCVHRDGRVLWAEHRAAVIRDAAGEIHALEGMCFDVTERVRHEEAVREQARSVADDRAGRLSQLIHHISHDLRHPVVGLHMYVRILRGALADDDRDAVTMSVQAIDEAGRQLDAMIQSLSDSARLETGQLPTVFQPINLGEFVGNLARRYAEMVAPRVIRTPRLDSVRVEADPIHLDRILNNLVSNAVKYSGTQEIFLNVEARGKEAIIAVADRGMGIAAEDLPHLFKRGYRSREATHLADGLGLGLYISYLLIEALSGRLWVESTPGQGSTFFVALPIQRG